MYFSIHGQYMNYVAMQPVRTKYSKKARPRCHYAARIPSPPTLHNLNDQNWFWFAFCFLFFIFPRAQKTIERSANERRLWYKEQSISGRLSGGTVSVRRRLECGTCIQQNNGTTTEETKEKISIVEGFHVHGSRNGRRNIRCHEFDIISRRFGEFKKEVISKRGKISTNNCVASDNYFV